MLSYFFITLSLLGCKEKQMKQELHYLPIDYQGKVVIHFGNEVDKNQTRTYIIDSSGNCRTNLKPNYWNTDNLERDAKFIMKKGMDSIFIPYLRENLKPDDKYFIDQIQFGKTGNQFYMSYEVVSSKDNRTY